MNAIEATGLTKSFDRRAVLDGLELKVPEGALYGLLGRNGAGKSTLMKTLVGLYLPERGSARVLGAAMGPDCPVEKRAMGYVAEGDILPAWARIGELTGFERGCRDEWDDRSLTAWLAAAGLTNRTKVGPLSKGLKKRLELELVLAGRPRVLILDEPLSGLDPVSRVEFLEHLMGFVAERRATVLISSHILNDLERVCDRIGVLALGRIAHETDMDALKEGGGRLEDAGVELIRRFDGGSNGHAA